MLKKKRRNKRGGAVIGLVLALFFFILLMGLFAFDASRAQMAQRELVALCDSAALAGTSMLASYDVSNDDASANYPLLQAAQNNAVAYARNMVQRGAVLGRQLTPTTAPLETSYATFLTPTLNECKIFIQLVNPAAGYAPVAIGSAQGPTGRAVNVQVCYGYSPVFWPAFRGSFPLSLAGGPPVYPLRAASVGGLPEVDTVMVFDYSGSMDNDTVVTIVHRDWNNTNQRIRYRVVPTVAGAADHRFRNYVGWNFTTQPRGFSINVLPPMSLAFLGVPGNISPYTAEGFNFERYVRRLRTANDYGSPPGNCLVAYAAASAPYANGESDGYITAVPSNGSGYGQSTSANCAADKYFTDIVVNIGNVGSAGPGTTPPFTQPLNGPDNYPNSFTLNSRTHSFVYSPATYDVPDPTTGTSTNYAFEPSSALTTGGTFDFSNIAFLVEAARGNLDSDANFNAAVNPIVTANGALATGLPAGSSSNPNRMYEILGATSGNGVSTGPNLWPTRKAGYQLAYQRLAMLYAQPFATCIDGAYSGFYQKLNGLADCRFGFVGFSDGTAFPGPAPNYSSGTLTVAEWIGSSQGVITYNPPDIGCYFWMGSARTTVPGPINLSPGFRVPRSQLNATQTQQTSFSNATNINWYMVGAGADGLHNSQPMAQTDCGEALQTAVSSFNNGGTYQYNSAGPPDRRAARRAIVFFTDGQPTDAAALSTSAATTANGMGVSFFCIGLAMNPAIDAAQTTFLGENAGGLCELAGNGSKYFKVTATADVKNAFAAVVRRLSQAQR